MPLQSDEVTELQSDTKRFILLMQADGSSLRTAVLRPKKSGEAWGRRVSVIIVLLMPSRPI